MIELKNLSKNYRCGDIETRALNGIHLTIAKNEFIAVMGPSGCGKSTLLNVLGMIDAPSGGDYLFLERNLARVPERELVELRKRYIGFIFQSFNLIDEMSVYENVELPLLYRNVARSERRNRVHEMLEAVGLQARAKHKPAQLSGGQQQRVAVARAMVGNPQLLLADEPTGNLDTRSGEDVMQMLAKFNEQGTTILMVTHSLANAACADRIVNMLDGSIVPADGPQTGDIYKQSRIHEPA